ncbi:MAG: DUF2101 family protein [Candidatus Diapherotrites archaeon]
MLREFLQENFEGFSWRSFIIIQLQALLVLMVLLLFARFSEFGWLVPAGEVLLSALYLYIVFAQVRDEFAKEFTQYAIFFLGMLVFVQAAWIMQGIFGEGEAGYYQFALLLALLLVFVVCFRMVFGRKYVPAKVLLSDGELAVVETRYDLLSFTNAGRHIVHAERKYAKGAEVKLKKIPFSRKYRVLG